MAVPAVHPPTLPPEGIHLTADLSGCRPAHPWMIEPQILRHACLEAVTRAGLTAVGDRFHHFPPADASRLAQGGITGVVLLAESHLAVHTWPEHGVVTLDVFVCNMRGDNTSRAQQVLQALIDGFAPGAQRVQVIRRGMPEASST
ncbi:MAG: adenosylmethionine decarboxylase [Aquabacterium sp.]